MNTTTKPPPDYGEPWREQTVSFMPGTIEDRNGTVVNARDQKLRALACVNACSGMADPAQEIASLNAERERLNIELSNICCVADAHTADEACEVLRAMREAIQKSHHILHYYYRFAPSLTGLDADAWCKTTEAHQLVSALAKLQPFVKP